MGPRRAKKGAYGVLEREISLENMCQSARFLEVPISSYF